MKQPSLIRVLPLLLCFSLALLWVGNRTNQNKSLHARGDNSNENALGQSAPKAAPVDSLDAGASDAGASKPLSTRVAEGKKEGSPFLAPEELSAYNQRAQRFAKLWLQRKSKTVTPELLEMMQNEPIAAVRQAMIVALGRLENPQALPALQQLSQRLQQLPMGNDGYSQSEAARDRIALYSVQLALGRIGARNLRGEDKLNSIASKIGTTWPQLKQDAARLRALSKTRLGIYDVIESKDRFILEEFYDVLYRMGKQGEDLSRLGASEIAIWENPKQSVGQGLRAQEQLKLEAASLSDAAEIEFWLNTTRPPSKAHLAPGHLLDLGPQVPVLLEKHLKSLLAEAKTQPQIMSKTSTYTRWFRAAAATGDRRFAPIFLEFQKVDDRRTKIEASQALTQLNSKFGLAAIQFP